MPAVFQIVSRASQKALAIGDPNYPHAGTGNFLWQLTQNNRLSCPFGGDSLVREGDRDAGAAEVDHRDERLGGVEAVGSV
jgi:hypothetical protein